MVRAYSNTAKIFQKAVPPIAFLGMIKDFAILSDYKNLSFEIDENVITGSVLETSDLVNVKAVLSGSAKKGIVVTYALIKEDGVWKISVIDTLGLMQDKYGVADLTVAPNIDNVVIGGSVLNGEDFKEKTVFSPKETVMVGITVKNMRKGFKMVFKLNGLTTENKFDFEYKSFVQRADLGLTRQFYMFKSPFEDGMTVGKHRVAVSITDDAGRQIGEIINKDFNVR